MEVFEFDAKELIRLSAEMKFFSSKNDRIFSQEMFWRKVGLIGIGIVIERNCFHGDIQNSFMLENTR